MFLLALVKLPGAWLLDMLRIKLVGGFLLSCMSPDHFASHEGRLSFLQTLKETTMPQATDLNQSRISLHDKLPLELLPVILGHLRYRQGELARTALVCKQWYADSKPVSVC